MGLDLGIINVGDCIEFVKIWSNNLLGFIFVEYS